MAVIARAQQRRTVAAMVEQSGHLADFLDLLRPDDLGRRTIRPGWDVATMAAYPVVMQAAALQALDRPTAARPSRLADFFSGLRPWLHRQQDLAGELARHDTLDGLRTRYRQDLVELADRLEQEDVPPAVETDQHPLKFLDLVRVLSVQLVVHCDDLVESLPDRGPMRWSRSCRADAVRALTDVLATRHPGQSIEVRVPPFAAVQCGTGTEDPRHTRGTPPTVVECDPLVLVRLCVGRIEYAEATRTGAVRASGSRSDLSSWLPLF
ncbi:sterol carrier family protein [Enemella dayhoffiae]|uniref:sterol carrier family protein n=1 Tax=Enemella dayhoffiae TaxID=2016507 RepID=UPI00113FD0CE|nr:sterol carrier family protein [Enemella dayhoffiae]